MNSGQPNKNPPSPRLVGARLEGGLRALNLLINGDWNGRIVFFARYRTGDGDTDDAGLRHGPILLALGRNRTRHPSNGRLRIRLRQCGPDHRPG